MRDELEDYLPIVLKILGAILLVVLIIGSIYTFKQVDTTLKNVETNVDAQIKAAISKFSVPSIGTTRTTTKTTSVASTPENISTIVAKAQTAFDNNDILEGRKQLVLLEQTLERVNGTETARQINRDLIAAIDKADIVAAQELSDKLLAELKRIGQN